ncbi:MAG: hypothetical protein U1E83_10075 [Methylotetracoccus sp.]
MGGDSYSDALISRFWDVVQTEKGLEMPGAIARALLYWPVYAELLQEIGDKPNKYIPECIKTVLTEITNHAEPYDNRHSVDWTRLLWLMLAATVNDDDQEMHQLLLVFYRRSEGEYGRHLFCSEGIGFYYRFAAAFQDWIVYHRSEPWYKNKNIDDKRVPQICKDCKAHIPSGTPSLDILYLLYENVVRTRDVFGEVFGLCPHHIDLEGDSAGSSEATVPLLKNFHQADEVSKRLWAEIIWMMREIGELAYVHSIVHRAQRTVENKLRGKDDEGAFQKLFEDVIYKKLHVQQITFFIRSLKDSGYDGHVAFHGTDFVVKSLELDIPPSPRLKAEPWKSRYDNFLKLVGSLYKNRLSKKFFKDVQAIETSATDKDRTFPFLLVPDGEVNFYYALALSAQKSKKLNTSHNWAVDKRIFPSEELFWEVEDWWTESGESLTGGAFPEDYEFLHHRCAALVSVAHMCGGSQGTRMQRWREHLSKIQERFCPVDKDGTLRTDSLPPSRFFSQLIDKDLEGTSLSDVLGNARISFLPEILMRAEDEQCHTLFFLPVGMKGRGLSGAQETGGEDDLDSYVPLAMVAGTLLGVEKRWLPFNSYRVVAHLYPLARMLQPMIDKMSHVIFLHGELEAREKRIEVERHQQEKARREHFENEFKTMKDAIETLAEAARKIKLELISAPLILLDPDTSKKLSGRFFGRERWKLTCPEVTDPTDKSTCCGDKVYGLTKKDNNFYFCPTHRLEDLQDNGSGVKYVNGLLTALSCEVHSTHDLAQQFFDPLKECVRHNDTWKRVFLLLKDLIHRAQDPQKKYITPWSILVPLCLLAKKESTVGDKVKITHDQQPLWQDNKVQWHYLMQIPYARASLDEEWNLAGAGYLIRAIYDLVGDALKPIDGDGGLGDAHVSEISVNVVGESILKDEDEANGVFELILKGKGSFQHGLRLLDPGDGRYHNLRSPLGDISKAVGAPPVLFKDQIPTERPQEPRLYPPLSVFQWWDSIHKFQMRIIFGRGRYQGNRTKQGVDSA